MEQYFKTVGDGLSLSVVIATIAGWLPSIAAALSIAWTAIQIYSWWKKK